MYFWDSPMYIPAAEPRSTIWFAFLKDSRSDSTPPSSLSMMTRRSLMNSAVLMATWFLSLIASSLYTDMSIFSTSSARSGDPSFRDRVRMEASSSSWRIPRLPRMDATTDDIGTLVTYISVFFHSEEK